MTGNEDQDFFSAATTSTAANSKAKESLKAQKKREEIERNSAKAASRELNPYLNKNSSLSSVSGSSGDKGAWLRRAFRRAEERAAAEGRSIEEIAEERWGSLETFEKLLAEAEGRDYRTKRRSSSKERRRRQSRSSSKERQRRRSRSSSRERQRKRSRSHERQRRRHRRRSRSSSYERPKLKFSRPDLDDKKEYKRRSQTGNSSSWKTDARKAEDERRIKQREEERNKTEKIKDHISPDHEREKVEHKLQEETKEKSPSKQDEEESLLTDKELNALGAKIVKAEIMGNDELAAKLKSKLAKAKLNRETAGSREKEQVVVVMSKGKDPPDSKGRSRNKKVETHAKEGRIRYFADDDSHDLKRMFEMEKAGTAEDHNAMLSRLVKGKSERVDDDYIIDDVMIKRASRQDTNAPIREREKAITHHRSLENCQSCFSSSKIRKNLIIATGDKCYLTLPPHVPLTEGHCFIIPMEHVSCAVQLDEDVYEEMQNFRKQLVNLFRKMLGCDVVFFESAMGLKRHPHMMIEVVPIPDDEASMAPMYFQKAIQECETEWSMNKKLIQLKNKGVRRSVPKGLPYFHVDFGMEDGFAHVIEDEDDFPKNFAQEIIGGMLDLDHRYWKNPKIQSFDEQRRRVLKFAEIWGDCNKSKSTD